jgi:hypothetical protein
MRAHWVLLSNDRNPWGGNLQTTTTTDTSDLIATAKRRGGLAAKLAAEIEATRCQLAAALEQLDAALDRSGPEYLADGDVQLAAWLAGVAADHPQLEEPASPMEWPVAARAQLCDLIGRHRCIDRASGVRPRAELLRIAAEIHDLCEAHGGSADLADAITMEDDDAWRQLHGTVRP